MTRHREGDTACEAQARMVDLAQLTTGLQERTEREKAQLARKLHDELGGLLTAAKMDLSWLQARIEAPGLRERLAQLGSALDEAMALKRLVVDELRPSLLDHFGLPIALKTHVESSCRAAGLRYSVQITCDLDSIPKDLAIALFRIVQEGLNNVFRHARAQEVRLEFTDETEEGYVLRLTDDGCGMSADRADFRWTGGLGGIRHRVEALGGRLGLQSQPKKGTVLSVAVPKTRLNAGASTWTARS